MTLSRAVKRNLAHLAVLTILSAATAPCFSAPVAVDNTPYQYGYLRLEINGARITNFAEDEQYQGWLEIRMVEAKGIVPSRVSGALSQSSNSAKPAQFAPNHWTIVSAILHSGRSGLGKLRFIAGDSGGLEPLFDVQKKSAIIPDAQFDLYDGATDKLIGKFKITGIRILSLEDVPASACGAYEITVSFRTLAQM